MRSSCDFCCSVGFLAGGGIFGWDWFWDCARAEDGPVFGKRGISSAEGKLGAGLAGGRRLLTRGTSASAKSKSVSDKASQFDMGAVDSTLGSAYLFYDASKPLNRCPVGSRHLSLTLPRLGETVLLDGMQANSLARHDLDALAVDGHGQNLGARLTNGCLHWVPRIWLD